MATAAAPVPEETAAEAPPPKKRLGKKKLVLLLVVALLVLAVGGAGAVVLLKKRQARLLAEAESGTAATAAEAHAKRDPKDVPTFVPLEMFTVNLADREAERYAQVGVTLELGDSHAGDQIKAYMPAIRHNILMVLAGKTANDLLSREGKERLAFEIRRDASRALGYEVPDPQAAKPKRPVEPSPIRAVQFSNFIIQ